MGGGANKGGFAERFRGSGNLAVKIPDNMQPADAAPLLCAGITVWSPIKKYVTKPGMKVQSMGPFAYPICGPADPAGSATVAGPSLSSASCDLVLVSAVGHEWIVW